MITRDRWMRLGLGILLILTSGTSGTARAEETFAEAWKLTTASVWPPAVIDGKLVLKNGDTLTAHSLKDGSQVWSKKLESLRYGAGVLDAGGRYIYVLGGTALYLLDPRDGHVVKKKPIKSPSYVYYHSGSVYVVAKTGVLRFDHSGDKVISKAKGYTGEIRGADGDYVVLYTHAADAKRLIVVNLKDGKKTYEFKLLPGGWHRVVKTGRGRVVFIDYSQRQSDGSNARKLYFTEADYVRSKKIKDQALHKRHPATYSSGVCDHFWVATNNSGIVFIGSHGTVGESSNLMAYDPGQDKLLWNRSGNVVDMGVLLHKGRLWTAVADREGGAHAVAYSPDDGSLLFRLPLDAAGSGAPVGLGPRVLLRTRSSIHCFEPREVKATVTAPPKSTPTPSTEGWRTYRDRTAGYLLQTPRSWRFDKGKLIKMGGLRMSIPFVRAEGSAYLGSVHVLTWEAADRDVNTLWSSIYAQRRQLNPDVRVVKVHKLRDVGGTGLPGVNAVYTFRSKTGYPVQLRSLCVVSHGVAFELRGWAGPGRPEEIWREIEGIFATFRPQRFR